MLSSLPHDLLEHILRFLHDDGVSVGRLSLCCTSLHQQISNNPDLWRELASQRWKTSSRYDVDVVREEVTDEDPRRHYCRRHTQDLRAREILQQMTMDLKVSLRVPEDAVRIDGSAFIGQAWEHLMWNDLLAMRGDVIDYLRKEARTILSTKNDNNDSAEFDVRLRAFLAARSLQSIQFAECLYEWKATQALQLDDDGRVDHATNALLLERYALLVNEIQQTPDQLILRPDFNVRESTERRLDQLADACRDRIQKRHAGSLNAISVMDQILVINEYLFQEEQFQGNSDDYYNYRNSLLDCVLSSKKGIPITLAILYSCVCRRLNLSVHLLGLPGHVVLGFLTHKEKEAQVKFLDVFNKGELMTLEDCRRVCNSYNVAWEDKYLQPLHAHQVLQRILNNLANCHFHGLATGNEAFHSDLFFHQRALASIHRQPTGIAAPLVDRVTQELPLTLSPDLLRFYGLLSPSRVRQATQSETT